VSTIKLLEDLKVFGNIHQPQEVVEVVKELVGDSFCA